MASPGSRTTGSEAKSFAIVSSEFNGELPAGVERIEAPTDTVWIIRRTQTNGPSDYDHVNVLQDGYQLTPLSQLNKEDKLSASRQAAEVDLTKTIPGLISEMSGSEYFEYASRLAKLYKAHKTDWTILSRLKHLGLKL